jgi:peptide/nickel transport system permease protein/oligopeptide transport system permease protein
MSEAELQNSQREASGQSGRDSSAPASKSDRPSPGPAQRAWHRFRKNRPAVFAAWYLAALLAIVTAWPVMLGIAKTTGARGAAWAKTYAPEQLSDTQFQKPSAQHWFGTDEHGRDVLSRVLYGAQISLLVGVVGAAVSLVIGVLWGSIAGFAGGRLDSVMMRTVDMLYSLPSIIFVIVLLTTVGEKLKYLPIAQHSATVATGMRLLILFIGLGAISWLTMARIVRGQVLSLRTRPFVDASRALGAGPLQILRWHIVPNVFGVVIVYLVLTVPSIVLYESFLSYLGLGVQPPMASWGSLISAGVEQINPIRVYWWLIIFPGGVLVSTLLALNFLGDGLRDAWDVKG